ncbi:hypothetical protein [Streptomyces erythrochromogenes]|uniref:hypothetical protein n=1 Tax=Streptomyces erythrochromogenes TaxID=285574 RepID=UPI0036CF656A
MGINESSAVAAVYRLAEKRTAAGLVRSLRDETLELLTRGYQRPRRLTEAVLASGDRELQAALARNAGLCTPRQRLRLARLGVPEIGRALYVAERWTRTGSGDEVRIAVLTAADPTDPAWRAPGGLVAMLLGETGPTDLAAAIHAPFPELALHALRHCGRDLPLPMLLRAARTLHARGGPEQLTALAALVDEEDGLGHPGLAALLRRAAAACADAEADAALAPGPGSAASLLAGDPSPTDELLYEVRVHGGGERAAHVPPDWELVRSEHARRPFSADALTHLNRWPGCPPDLAVEGLRGSPRTALLQGTGPLPLAVLTGPEAEPARSYVPRVLQRGLREGWLAAERLFTEVTPAADVIGCLPKGDELVGKAVRELTAPLGSDPAAWLALYRRINRFEGTATALVAAACADAGRRGPAPSWPRPIGAAFPCREPEGARALFQRLFEYAEEAVQEALLPHLDVRAVQHLLVFGTPSPRLRERITAVHGRAAQVAHASRWDLPGETVEELLDLDDPEVNEKLYLYGAIAREERERILEGRGRGGGPVPVTGGLLDALTRIDLRHHRNWVSAGLPSGDPRVLRVVLGRIRTHTEAGRLRVLIRLWERHGPEAVRSLMAEEEFPGRAAGAGHPLPAATHKTAAQALASPDGPALLRTRLAAEEDPVRLIAVLRRAAAGTVAERVRHLAQEGTALPWPQLVEAHTADPLPVHLLRALAQQPDCPRPLLLEALGAGPVHRGDDRPWLVPAMEEGRLIPADILRRCGPAAEAVSLLAGVHTHWPTTEDPWSYRVYREARTLTRTHLGTSPETWTRAARLLPTFPGPLPALLTAATADSAPADRTPTG